MKVIIIPSWYPTENNPIGSFFREQAQLMSTRCELKVVYCEYHRPGWRILLKKLLRFSNPFKIKQTNNYLTPPEVIGFEVPRSKICYERTNFNRLKKAYINAFEELINKKNWQPDLIHAQSTFDGGIIAYEISKIFHIPYLVTEHDLFLLHSKPEFIRSLAFKSLENANKVLTVSTDKIRQILMHGINCSPDMIGNLVDDTIFTLKPSVQNEFFTITIVAANFYLKDWHTFFSTIQKLKSITSKKFKVKVIGLNAWDLNQDNSELIEFTKILEIYDLCEFYPLITRSEIVTHLHKSDVFVLTSIAEGLPVSVLEALSCGVPVFSTICGGVEEIINDSNGRLVKIKDYKGLANYLNQLIEGKIVFIPSGVRNSIINRFGKRAFLQNQLLIYEEILNNVN